jgi:hypothetical protein
LGNCIGGLDANVRNGGDLGVLALFEGPYVRVRDGARAYNPEFEFS